MDILTGSGHIRKYVNVLAACLRREGTRVGSREGMLTWNRGLGFWFDLNTTSAGHRLRFGVDDPQVFLSPKPACTLLVNHEGRLGGSAGAFVSYGSDVMLAYFGPAGQGRAKDYFRFLDLHKYDLAHTTLARPGASKREVLLITSVNDDAAALNLHKFIRSVLEFKGWVEGGLFASRAGTARCPASHAAPLEQSVLLALGEQLAKLSREQGLSLAVSHPAGGGLAISCGDEKPVALFEILQDITPDSLARGVGRLVLSRAAVLGAKFLALPAQAGPFVTQALHRNNIHVVTYTLTKSGVVFFDLDYALERALNA